MARSSLRGAARVGRPAAVPRVAAVVEEIEVFGRSKTCRQGRRERERYIYIYILSPATPL